MMAALGLPTTRIQAAFAPSRGFGALTTLRSAADVVRFLTTGARFPLFGKPGRGAQAMGSVLIAKVADGVATLGWDIAITPDGALLIECKKTPATPFTSLPRGAERRLPADLRQDHRPHPDRLRNQAPSPSKGQGAILTANRSPDNLPKISPLHLGANTPQGVRGM